jgi:hypothetical protein
MSKHQGHPWTTDCSIPAGLAAVVTNPSELLRRLPRYVGMYSVANINSAGKYCCPQHVQCRYGEFLAVVCGGCAELDSQCDYSKAYDPNPCSVAAAT